MLNFLLCSLEKILLSCLCFRTSLIRFRPKSLGSGDASGDDEGSGNWIDPALYDVYTGNRTESGYIPLDSDGNPLFGATTTCEDVDECVLGLHDCNYDLVQTCYNTAPGKVFS